MVDESLGVHLGQKGTGADPPGNACEITDKFTISNLQVDVFKE